MHKVKVNSILNSKNGLNLYRGCQHNCIYCDSRSKCYNINHDFLDIEVKENAIELLNDELSKKRKKVMIGTGSMCDPYMPLEKELKLFENELLLNGEFDKKNAIIELHPGAGGTESQDWALMLYRMYKRYTERHNFKFELIDYQDGNEAGIKSVTFSIMGKNAYGMLKGEGGVHRLVRISPFDSASRRHTSFVSCTVIPDIDEEIEIEIKDEDLRIDTYRASGAGGQHINKTDSAVRITHLPTGIVVCSQSQRSQIQNREKAMQVLKSRLYQKEHESLELKKKEAAGEMMENGWGSQIRSYILHPYALVKDHRTNVESNQPQVVLDGDIDVFLMTYLQWLKKGDENV